VREHHGHALRSDPMKFLFGDCTLESTTRQLWRGGKIVPLEPKMYELLEVLIQRRPAVVTNEELDELLWPKAYVARTSLTRLISELRSVLGDTPRDSRILRTAYKKGYAFCADVVESAGPSGKRMPVAIHLVWNEQALALTDGEHIAGRGAECSLVIDAATVSRRHARFTVAAGTVTVEDLQSTNGTCVNGTPIAGPTQLANGNQISLGSEILVLKKRDPSALTVRTDRGSESLRDGGRYDRRPTG
jgi:DNA-binding winged helix-turn-helix (wHTH) protein